MSLTNAPCAERRALDVHPRPFWREVASFVNAGRQTVMDTHHRFGPDDALIIDRSSSWPPADSRLVHYDPGGSSYFIATGDRIRFGALEGATVFQETSPWDAQIRQDPPVNFHAIVQSPVHPEATRVEWARGWRGPFLHPVTEAVREATVRDLVAFSPAGTAHYVRDLRVDGRHPADAGVRLAVRVALDGDELLVSYGAQNLGPVPLRVSLISFFLPLLTRGMTFNAESAWFHEGWAVGDDGFVIRSSEHGIACAIRRATTAPVEHWSNLDTLAYYGGPGRTAAFPAAVERGEALEHRARAGFVAPACAHSHDRRVLEPGEELTVHFGIRATPGTAAALVALETPLWEAEIDARVEEAKRRGRALIESTRLGTPSPALSSFYEWTKQQVSGCARIRPRFRLFDNYLLGIRDKAQAAYAAVDFDAQVGRDILLELSHEQFEDGRFPRQYSPEGAYDLRYFMDSGLWLPTLLVPHYLKMTGDFAVLFEEAGYRRLAHWDPVTKAGKVVTSRRRRTVLDHLIENVEHVLRNRDPETGLVRIHDGDWNDAIGLIETSTMVLQQLYWALAELVDLAAHLPERWRRHLAARRLRPRRYRALMDDLHRTFRRRCIQSHPDGRKRILHGYTHEGRTVGGFWDTDGVADEAAVQEAFGADRARFTTPFVDADGRTLYKLHRRFVDAEGRKLERLSPEARALFVVDRVSSTPLSFAVLSGILRHRAPDGDDEETRALEAGVVRDAQSLRSPYGWKTFSQPFGRHSRELGIGRIGKLDGAENASPYVHAGMFLCEALYQLGHEQEAGEFLTQSLPINRALHAEQNRAVQYTPNSWGIGPHNDGASMNDFHTNAASILSRILVRDVVGLRPTYEGVVIQPAARLPEIARTDSRAASLEYRARVRGRSLRIVHEWTSAVRERSITLRGEALAVSRSAFVPWSDLHAEVENVVVVHDPLEE